VLEELRREGRIVAVTVETESEVQDRQAVERTSVPILVAVRQDRRDAVLALVGTRLFTLL